MDERYCRCPGCGECSAHANEPALKKKLNAANARADALEAALSDVLEMAQEHADHFAAAFAGYKPERHAYYARALATARALLEKT